MRCRHLLACGAWVALFCAAASALNGQTNPGWWGNYGVVTTPIPATGNATLYDAWVAQNYLPANLGQLKNFATQAQAYLDNSLAGIGGAGPDVDSLVANFTVSSPYNFAPVNLGQIKAVAAPVYDRLYAVGFNATVGLAANFGLTGLAWNGTAHYPWPYVPGSGQAGYDEATYNGTIKLNYLPANLGQLKSIFSFDLGNFTPSANLSIAGDGIPDWWKTLNGLDPFGGNLSGNTDFGDGRTDLQEYLFTFNLYNGTVGGTGNVSGFQTAYTTESTSFPAVPANYTSGNLVFPRQPVPQYAAIDLGEGSPDGIDDYDEVLLAHNGGGESYYFNLWSAGNIVSFPDGDGEYTWGDEEGTPPPFTSEGVVIGTLSDGDATGLVAWDSVDGVFDSVSSDDFSDYLPEGYEDAYVNFDSLAADGTVYLEVDYDYEVYLGEEDDGDDTFTPEYHDNVEAIPFAWVPGESLEPLTLDSSDEPVVIGYGYNMYPSTSTQDYTYTLDTNGNYSLTNHEHITYELSDDTDEFDNNYWTDTVTATQNLSTGAGNVALPNLYGSDTDLFSFRPPLFDFGTPFLFEGYSPEGGVGFLGSVVALSGGNMVTANLTSGGSTLEFYGMNSLGFGVASDVGGANYGLWLNGNILNYTDVLPAADFYAGNTSLNLTALLPSANLSTNSTVYLAAIAPNTTTASLAAYDSVSGNYEGALLIPASLAVDNNRDGNISLDSDDQTSPTKPFRFWLNDDDGSGNTSGDDVPQGAGNGNAYNTSTSYGVYCVNGAKDLVNYFPVYLNIGQLIQQYPPGNYTYKLSQADDAVNFLYTNLTLNNPFDYLRNSAVLTANTGFGDDSGTGSPGNICTQGVTYATKHLVGDGNVTDAYTLSGNFLANITTNTTTSWGVILVDGRGNNTDLSLASTNPLVLTVYNSSNVAVQHLTLPMRIDKIENMYRTLDLRNGNNAPPVRTDPDTLIGLVGGFPSSQANSLTTNLTVPPNFPDSINPNGWFVFVEGSNVNGYKSRGWIADVFKKLYWSHNKAKFVGVSWYGDPYDSGGDIVYDYTNAEQNAIITAPNLMAQVNNMAKTGNVTVAGHSLGCMLISSALDDDNPRLNVKNAIFVDAAITSEAFDGNADIDLGNMTHPSWYVPGNSTATYPSQLWAANWWNLFTSGNTDLRATLTWQGRFNVQTSPTTASYIYNFYSSTEDVLGKYSGAPPEGFITTLLTAYNNGFGASLQGLDSWNIDQKALGNKATIFYIGVPGLDFNITAHTGTDYGGWGFNLGGIWNNGNLTFPSSLYTPAQLLGNYTLSDMEAESKSTPLFKTSGGPDWLGNLFDNPITGFQAISQSMVSDYRNQLLAEAIPALSKPAGANPVSKFAPSGLGNPGDRNFNIPVLYTDPSIWPNSFTVQSSVDVSNWHHSDMHVVAYPYLYQVYDEFVQIANP